MIWDALAATMSASGVALPCHQIQIDRQRVSSTPLTHNLAVVAQTVEESAVVIFASPSTSGHSPKARSIVTNRRALVERADQMEQELTTGLCER